MKLRSPAGLAAGLVSAALLAAPAVAAGPANVHVRVEGTGSTLVPRTALATNATGTVNKDGQAGHDCTSTSAAGALEKVTAGDWTGQWFDGLGYGPTRILTETRDPATSYWAVYLNYRYSDLGICGIELQTGDDLLLLVDCFSPPSCATKPLRLSRVPATAAPGSTAAVLVETFEVTNNFPNPSETRAVPAEGATVSVGGRAFTTGSDGIAQITYAGSGPVTVQATKAGLVRSATEQTCVTTGSDGACGSVVPSTPDTTAPVGRILGIRDGQRFTRRRAPRELRGRVTADPSGLWAVKIRLTRRHKGTCWYFSGSKEQFLERTCGKKYAFKIGDRAEWSYLLPARLKPGRYVLDVYGVDNAFNKGAIVRGTSRVVFRVR
jgi:hypothetical protein